MNNGAPLEKTSWTAWF